MRRQAACLFCILSLAGFSTRPAASEETTPSAATISPWTKFCLDKTCFIGADIRNECGPIGAAVLIEENGKAKTILRTTLPPHVKREPGSGVAIDQAEPIIRPFGPCYANGCVADYEAGPELLDQLKHGQTLTLSGVDGDNSAIRLTLPLAGFAEAYDGPPTEPKAFENQSGKLQEELQRRANGQASQAQPAPLPKPRCSSQN
jgi:invasion protein IalB